MSVSLPESLTERVRRRVGRGSFSRYVSEAVERQIQQDELADWLTETQDHHGSVPADIREQIDVELGELDEKWRREGF